MASYIPRNTLSTPFVLVFLLIRVIHGLVSHSLETFRLDVTSLDTVLVLHINFTGVVSAVVLVRLRIVNYERLILEGLFLRIRSLS